MDIVLLGVAGKHEGQGPIASDITGGAKAVLEGENGHHQARTSIIKAQDTDDESQRSHDRTARNTRSAHGENAQQKAEQNHGQGLRQLSIEHLGYRHHEEYLGQHRSAQVDVGEQRDTKVHHITAQNGGLLGAAQSHSQGGGGGHSTHSGEVGGAVVLHNLHRIGAGIGTGQAVQHGHPDEVTHYDDEDNNEEYRQLFGNGALKGQATEGGGNEEGQDGDDHLGHDGKYNLLKLLQDLGSGTGVCPGGSQPYQHREDQSGQ